jgi:hypothetical protein
MTLLNAKLVHEVAHDRGNVVATGEAKRGKHRVILALDLCTCVYEVSHGLGGAIFVRPHKRFPADKPVRRALDALGKLRGNAASGFGHADG